MLDNMKNKIKNKIKNKKDYKFFLKADRFALGIDDSLKGKIYRLLFPNYILRFQEILRKDFSSKILYIFIKRKFYKLSRQLGFSIPINVFGPGLSIPHYGTIVVNQSAKIGCNCRLHACVTIGASGGSAKSPLIGNNCYIGSGAKIFGDIVIPDSVVIGANSVVNKSVTESHIAVAGNPFKKTGSFFDIEKVVLFSVEAVEKRVEANPFLPTKDMNTIIKQ
jgi:serine O-acetyltransferase